MICVKNNSKTGPPLAHIEVQARGESLGEDWQIDFTVLPEAKGKFCYLLVVADTFTGWVETCPCQTEKVSDVVKVCLRR